MSVITGTLIPAPPTGKDFLKSSNTLIVKDNYGATPDQIYLTTFQRDFWTSGHLTKRGRHPCPKPAQMQHKDHGILERCTEALSSFTRPQLQAIHRIPAWAKLGTNLRMHADRRQATFCTTQAEGYKLHPSHSAAKLARPTLAIQISTRNGKLPQTTHRETFPAFITLPVVKAPVKHLGGEPTIRGDYDRPCFSTHHKDTFQGRWAPPPAPVEKQFHSALAMGDPEKLVERETTHAATFRPPEPPRPEGALERLKVNLGDSENKWVSTTADAYRRVKTERVQHVQKIRTQSSVPRGDLDPQRNQARMMDTTNRFFFPKGSHWEFPSHVDGSRLITRSNVQFGRPSLGTRSYNTSSSDDYPRKEAARVLPHTNPSGRVLSGLVPEPAVTTVQRDYRPSNGKRQELHPRQLKQVKESHISPPCKEHHFSTTHNEAFTPMPLSRKSLIDTHSHLYSHIPL